MSNPAASTNEDLARPRVHYATAMRSLTLALFLALFAVGLSGCVIALGNRDIGEPRSPQATLGQQLIDLKKARDAGALTEAEYEAQKEKLLREKKKKKEQ